MGDVCLNFVLHFSPRLRSDEVTDGDLIDATATADAMKQQAAEVILPALNTLGEAVADAGRRFRFALCPTGPLLESARTHVPAVIEALRKLGETGCVEWVAAPDDWSIFSIFGGDHVTQQTALHADRIADLLGARPTAAMNTEFIYDNTVAPRLASAGFTTIMLGYADRQLAGRTANKPYRPPGEGPETLVTLLPRHVALSDDWAVRLGNPDWVCHPLSPDTYATWVAESLTKTGGPVCTLALMLRDVVVDAAGTADARRAKFAAELPPALLGKHVGFVTPSQVHKAHAAGGGADVLDVPQATTAWGPGFDLSPWLGNAMQSNVIHLLRRFGRLADVPAPLRSSDTLRALRVDDDPRHLAFEALRRLTRTAPPDGDPASDAYGDYRTTSAALRQASASSGGSGLPM